MNSLTPNFAERLASTSPIRAPQPAMTTAADEANQAHAPDAFSAHLAAQRADATAASAARASDSSSTKTAAPDSTGKHGRKATDGDPAPSVGKSLPAALPVTLPVPVPVAAAPSPATAAATVLAAGPGSAEGDDDGATLASAPAAGSGDSLPDGAPAAGAIKAATAAATASAALTTAANALAVAKDQALGRADAAAAPRKFAPGGTALPTGTPVPPVAKGPPPPVSAAVTAQDSEASLAGVTVTVSRAGTAPLAPRALGQKAAPARAAGADPLATTGAVDPGVGVAGGRAGVVTTDAPATLQVPVATSGNADHGADPVASAADGATGAAPAATDPGLLVPMLSAAGAAPPATPAAALPHAPAVQVPVGAPEWGQAVGASVTWAASQNLTHAQISLNPDHLGPLEIRLSLVGGEASVAFSTHSHAAAQALNASSDQLRAMLGQAGFTQVNVDISQQSGRQPAFGGSAYREQAPPATTAAAVPVGPAPRLRASAALDAYA